MLWTWMKYALPVLLLTAPVIAAPQSSAPAASTYRWSAELVSMETASSALTLKAWIAYPEVQSHLKQFKAGDKVTIFWSGLSDYASGIREVRRTEGKIQEELMLPAELVSTEAPNQYLTFRIKVPADSLAAIKDLKPGEWVTVTSRHRPSTENEAVVSVKPYNS